MTPEQIDEMRAAFIADLRAATAKAREAGISAIDAAGIVSLFADNLDDEAAREVWGLTSEEQREQAGRCLCGGSDEYCPCQNSPTRRTIKARATQ